MASSAADRPPDDAPTGALPPGPAGPGAEAPPSPPAVRRGRAWAAALAAGMVAGFASWAIGEASYDRFRPPLPHPAGFPTPEEVRADALARNAGVKLEVTLSFGALGAVLGLALGLAGGLARGSGRSAAVAAASGAILGGLAAVAAVQLLLPVHFRYFNPDRGDLPLALAIQGGICGVIGAAGGAAFGLGLGGGRRVGPALVGGLVGGVVGALVFQIVGVLAFPLDQTTRPLASSWAPRLARPLAVALLASAGAARSALSLPRPSPRTPSPSPGVEADRTS